MASDTAFTNATGRFRFEGLGLDRVAFSVDDTSGEVVLPGVFPVGADARVVYPLRRLEVEVVNARGRAVKLVGATSPFGPGNFLADLSSDRIRSRIASRTRG